MTDGEAFLISWHARHAGTSAEVFGRASDSAGRNSYDRLAAALPAEGDVLDLACGDGMLLATIAARSPRAGLTGIDMTPAEVDAAQRRFADSPAPRGRGPGASASVGQERPYPRAGVRVVVGNAQALPFADATFDVVTCHMALMLMDQVDDVIGEVRRVLRPGGIFVGTVGADSPPGGAASILAALGVLRRQLEIPHGADFGDARCRTPAELAVLLAGFEGFEHEVFDVEAEIPHGELGAFLRESYYGLDDLPIAEVAALLEGLDLPAVVRWPFRMVQFRARRG